MEGSIGTLIEIAPGGGGGGQCVCGGGSVVCGGGGDADASDQQTSQHTWPLVTMQACFHDRIQK